MPESFSKSIWSERKAETVANSTSSKREDIIAGESWRCRRFGLAGLTKIMTTV